MLYIAPAAQLLAEEHHIYIIRKGPMAGRINVSAVTFENVDYLAKSIHQVTPKLSSN